MQATVLQGYSREVMAAENLDAVVSITLQALVALFRVPAVVILIADGRVISIKRNGDIKPEQAELEAAQASLATGTVSRGGVYPHLASRFDFWPVQTTKSQTAVIGLAFDPDERPPAPDTPVTVVASLLALVLDRQHGPDRSVSTMNFPR
jgi:K+-sensing histidine kinase KdpD